MKFCPECGQKVPSPTVGCVCGRCQRRIAKGEPWHIEGSVVLHVDCDAGKKAAVEQGSLDMLRAT